VYRARDRRLDRDVAAKILHLGHGEPQARERFLREALLGGRISHPNAVKVLDAGEDGAGLYIIMELVAGEGLAARLARAGPLREEEAVAIAVQVLDVLDAAHRVDVVHRDVKPSNILLGEDGRARLVDFGIAKPLQDLTAGLTRTGEILGTAKYLSPEQARGDPPGPATDLYAVGAVLFDAVSGRPPFIADSPVALVLAHRDETPPPLASVTDAVHPGVAAVIDQALAKDPSQRPSSAAAMGTALRNALEHPRVGETAVLGRPAPPPAAPASAPVSTSRRTILIAGAVGALLGLAAVALANRDGDDRASVRSDAVQDTTSTAPASTVTIATTTTTAPTTTTTTTVVSIGTLTDLLSAGPENYGKKGRDLLDKLQELQRERGRDRAEKAADLIEDIDDWVDDGELDAAFAAQARQLLEPLASPGRGNSDDD
jgi:serine/threonine-protein kinase